MAYHKVQITKGKIGEFSKIYEEFMELSDAHQQQNPVLELCEIADLIGAIDLYTQKNWNLGIFEIIKMSRATQNAFIEGTRS